jgi:hypothetical protein
MANSKDIDEYALALIPTQDLIDAIKKKRGSIDDNDMSRNMAAPLTYTRSAEVFDLMQVSITIYSLSGITAEREIKKSRGKLYSRIKAELRRKKKDKPIYVRKTTQNLSADSIEVIAGDGIPTTAVISCQRKATSSHTILETFLPSLPLFSTTSPRGETVRYKALWRASDDHDSRISGEQASVCEPSTFKKIRAMKRESYNKETKIQHLSSYQPETVDLKLSIGRGTELIVLGEATFAFTGDEEGEVMMNLPVKPLNEHTNSNSAAKTKKKRLGKKRRNLTLSHNKQKAYSLDENATLRVGIKALSHQAIEEANQKAIKERELTEKRLGMMLSDSFDENAMVIELDDENLLIEKLIRGTSDKTHRDTSADTNCGATSFKDVLAGCTPIGNASMFASWFDPMQFFLESNDKSVVGLPVLSTKSNKLLPPETINGYLQPSRKDITKQEALVMPLSFMSDVSDSTDGSEESNLFQSSEARETMRRGQLHEI